MPSFKKNTTARPARAAAPVHKPGSKSPKHRGYRPAEASAAPVKKRWNADDRAKRSEATGSGKFRASKSDVGKSPARADRRPDWQPNGSRPEHSDRPRYDKGADRARYSKDAAARPRTDSERPARHDRDDRPARVNRDDRGGEARRERPAYQGRPDRPARDDRRPEWKPRTDRVDHTERQNRSDRPVRDDRRPAHDSRPPREDRPRRDSDFYPAKDAGSRFTAHEDVVLEKLEAEAIQAADVIGVTFADLGLGGNIVRELADQGALAPFPIQAATIPDVLKGKDVLGRGKTGSGKTIAFGAPLVERLMENGGAKGRKPGRRPRALILAPTGWTATSILSGGSGVIRSEIQIIGNLIKSSVPGWCS